jgi:hypothetical protein
LKGTGFSPYILDAWLVWMYWLKPVPFIQTLVPAGAKALTCQSSPDTKPELPEKDWDIVP